MEVLPPPWLNETFLATVLQGGEDIEPHVTIVEFTSELAAAVGYNYTSYVFRVIVEYKVGESPDAQTVTLIVKAPIEKGLIGQMTEKMNLFAREPRVYNDLLPKMNEKAKINFGPDVYYCPIKKGLVMKDLKSEGYILGNRFQQLDLSHCKQVISMLAKFHATSVACHHEDPIFIQSVGEEPVYSINGAMSEEVKSFTVPIFSNFLQVLNTIGDQQELVDFVSKRIPNIWDSLVELFKPRKDGLNVLNHGDCWTANLLFKEDDAGKATAVKLIDFQALRYTSPVIDLIYFLWTSANEDVRENHREDLYSMYIQTLNGTFLELGCDERLSYEELERSLKEAIDWALVQVASTIPLLLNDLNIGAANYDDDAFDMNQIMEMFQKTFDGKYYRALLPGILRQFKALMSSL